MLCNGAIFFSLFPLKGMKELIFHVIQVAQCRRDSNILFPSQKLSHHTTPDLGIKVS